MVCEPAAAMAAAAGGLTWCRPRALVEVEVSPLLGQASALPRRVGDGGLGEADERSEPGPQSPARGGAVGARATVRPTRTPGRHHHLPNLRSRGLQVLHVSRVTAPPQGYPAVGERFAVVELVL